MEVDGKNAIIRLFHVHKYYRSQKALVDITLDIFKNEFLFISGPSGAGKSTLLKLLFLAESATKGHILVDGQNVSRISKRRIPALRRKFGIIFQDYKLIPTRSVYDNVALALEVKGTLSSRMIRKKVSSVLRTVGMEDRMYAFPPTLSGGEQQRVAVARAMVADPAIILADEPTGSLDPDSADAIVDLLERYHSKGATLIVATHDRYLLERSDVRIIHLKNGRRLSNPET